MAPFGRERAAMVTAMAALALCGRLGARPGARAEASTPARPVFRQAAEDCVVASSGCGPAAAPAPSRGRQGRDRKTCPRRGRKVRRARKTRALRLPAGADGCDRDCALDSRYQGPGGCGGEDLVRLEAIVLPDKRQVPVKPAAILRCKMAAAIADWIRTDIAPLAQGLGTTISGLDNFDSFECRGRNRVVGAMLSEHGRANALDVRCFKLASGRAISLTDRSVPRDRARARAAFGLRAIPHRARAGLRLVPRGSHPSRPDGAAKQLPDLPVECVGPAAAGRTAVAGRAAGGRAAPRGRCQIRHQVRCRETCRQSLKPRNQARTKPEDKPAPAKKPTKKRR